MSIIVLSGVLSGMRTSSSDGGESFAESQGSLRITNAEGFYLRFSKHACRSGSEINSIAMSARVETR